jgi:CRP-like cAMP-binding protein
MTRLPLVSPLERALFLKAQPYLEGLSSGVLAVLASYSEERFYRAGGLIHEGGKPIDALYFLGRGEVVVEGRAADRTRRRAQDARVSAPGAIGLAHYFAGTHRPPAVYAAADTLCLTLSTADLDQILEDHFPLILQFTRTTCWHATLAQQALGPDRKKEQGFGPLLRREMPIEVDLVQLLARMRKAPFFRNVNLTVLAEMIRGEEPEAIPAGRVLWSAGDPIDRLVFVLDGEFRSRGPYGCVRAGSGATIGSWELMVDGVRSEDWLAEKPSRILSIPKELFADLLEDHFDFSVDYLKRISARLVRTWDQIAEREEASR